MQVALVTGASGALGQAVAVRLARDGFSVAVHFHTSGEVACNLTEALDRSGRIAMSIQADLACPGEARRLVSDVVERFGQLDLLVHSVGIIRDALLVSMTDEEIDDVLAVNLRSTLVMGRAAAEHMVMRHQGCIINISSAAATSPRRGHANYVASKAGLEGFTRAAAIELGAKGIRVNAVAPGVINSPMTEAIRLRDEGLPQRMVLGRLGHPEDVAGAVSFLASPDASYITGQVLRVDGGGQRSQ